MADDGDLPSRPLTNAEINWAFRIREEAEKQKSIDEFKERIKIERSEELEKLAAGFTGDDIAAKEAVAILISDAARNINNTNYITADRVFLAVVKAEENQKLVQQQTDNCNKPIQPTDTPEHKTQSAQSVAQKPAEQPPPDIKQADDDLIAERLAQKARMNNADMDRLASFGPKHADYRPLNADQIQQRFGNPELMAKYHQDEQNRTDARKAASPQQTPTSSDVTASNKHDTGLMADFVTAKTKKEDAEQTIQQQWKEATNVRGMTRR